jgi:hypothetical protein
MGKVSWTEALEIMQEPPVDEQATSPDEQYFSAQDELNDSGLDITVPADELSRLPVRYVEAEPSYALSDDESPVFIAQPAKVVNPMVQRRSRNPSPRGPEATVNVLKKRGPNKPRLNPEHTSRPPQTVSLENSTEQPTKRRPGRPRKKPVAQSTSLNTPEKEHSFLPSLPDGERDRTQVQAGRSATSSSPNQFQSVDIRQTQNSTWIPTSASSPRIAAQQSKSSKSVLSGSRMEIPDSEADTSTDINSSAPNLSAQLETTDSMELDVGISTIGEAGPSPDAEGEILFPHASPSNTSSRVIKDSQESSESTSSVANSVPTPRTNFSSRHKMRSQTHKSSPLKPQTKTPGKAQQQSVSSPIPPRSATRDTPQASRSTKIQRTKTSRSSRPSRFSILSLVGEDKDDDELLGAPGDAVSVARLFGSARKTTWKSSAMTTEVLRTPSKKQKYSTGLARESLSPGSIIVTPGGSKRQCGLDGFRCGRDFCFTCLS